MDNLTFTINRSTFFMFLNQFNNIMKRCQECKYYDSSIAKLYEAVNSTSDVVLDLIHECLNSEEDNNEH